MGGALCCAPPPPPPPPPPVPPAVVFCPLLKNLTFCCECPYEEKKSKNFVLPPFRALLFWGVKIAHA